MASQEALSELDVGHENGQGTHDTAVATLPKRLVPARSPSVPQPTSTRWDPGPKAVRLQTKSIAAAG